MQERPEIREFYRSAGIDSKGEEFLEGWKLAYQGIRSTLRGGARFLTGVFDALPLHRHQARKGHHRLKIMYPHPPIHKDTR